MAEAFFGMVIVMGWILVYAAAIGIFIFIMILAFVAIKG